MQKMIGIIKQCYRKCKKKIAIRCGNSKEDSFEGVVVKRAGEKPVIWLLGTEDFGNLGDHKIAVAIRNFIDRFFYDYDVIEVSARNYFEHCEEIEKSISADDVIFGTGGGNFGNQYMTSQKIRRDFVSRFHRNPIIIMPQTVWYTQDEAGENALAEDVILFAQHERLLLIVREEKSFQFVKEHFQNKVFLAPDMVLSETPFDDSDVKVVPHKAVLCLRSDLEGILDSDKQKHILKIVKKHFGVVKKVDTQKDYLISTKNRVGELQEMLAEMASAELVVTDRLHGMVFAALAQTPCIVFDNYNGKVKGIYKWMKSLPYIRYKGTDTDIENDIKALLPMKGRCQYRLSEAEGCFEIMAEKIREI